MTAATVRNRLPVLSPSEAGKRYVVCYDALGNVRGEPKTRRILVSAADDDGLHMPRHIKQSAPRCRVMHDIFVNALASNAGSCAVTESANVRATD